MYSYLLDKTDLPTSMVPNLSNFVLRLITSSFPSATAIDARHSAKFDLLKPLRNWLDNLNVSSPSLAHKLCKLIPSQCPFERDITLFGHKIVHIPHLCKLNPLYDHTVGLRFRPLSYLADECGEDVLPYCS